MLVKNQQKSSSSIQRLKIVKKVSVSSAAAATGELLKREVLSSNSVERPNGNVANNSSNTLIEQGRVARINASSVNQDYSSVGRPESSDQLQGNTETSNPRLSINTRKSKPITVSFKNIVKASISKRKASHNSSVIN